MKLAKCVMKKHKKCVVSENSCSKIFVNFQEKHAPEIAFLNKVAGYVCVCVFIFFYREDFFRLQDVQDILEGTDQRSCVVNIS